MYCLTKVKPGCTVDDYSKKNQIMRTIVEHHIISDPNFCLISLKGEACELQRRPPGTPRVLTNRFNREFTRA